MAQTVTIRVPWSSLRALVMLLGAAAMGLIFSACAERPGPTGPVASISRSEARDSDGTCGCSEGTGGAPAPLRFTADAPPLQTYDTSFVFRQGQESENWIYFQRGPGDPVARPFMTLLVPETAQFVDATGAPAPPGSLVRLTVHVDSQTVQFGFGPHGSRFPWPPAWVTVYTRYVDTGARKNSELRVWLRSDEGEWESLCTTIDVKQQKLRMPLLHFSNYRVAF